MSTEFQCRPARPGEGKLVARWIARSLDPAILPLTIWRSPRIHRWIESVLRGRSEEGAPRFYLLHRGGLTAGLAALRCVGDAAFVNHLMIGARWRGRGLGGRLLAEAAADFLERRPKSWIALDAFAGRPAERWYRRLGFAVLERRAWYVADPGRPKKEQEDGIAIRGLAEADRAHRRWGFSSFRAGPYEVGRLYERYFRLTDRGGAMDSGLRRLLARLDPERRLLLVAPGAKPGPGWEATAVSVRLICRPKGLLERLGR